MKAEEMIEYIIPLLEGRATPEQEKEVREWVEASPENRREYDRLAALYYKLNYARDWKKIDTDRAVRQMRKTIFPKRRGTGRIYYFSGVAALFFICFGVFLLIQKQEKMLPARLAVTEEVKSGEMKAMLTLADGRKVELSSGNNVNVDLGFARAVEDSLKGLVYQFKDSVAAPREFHTLTVPRAGEYIMVLSDGTRVWLNSETELRYPVNFDRDKREVFLLGEAYFEVVKDARRPFVVVTPQVKTTVLGTSFNVMAYKGESHTEVTLVSGVVAVKAGRRECRLVPGRQAAVDNESLKIDNREVVTSFYTSWKDGLFDFDHMSLSELCVKLSRWYDVDFFFVNQVVAEKSFTGAIKRSKDLQFILDFVQKTSGVRFEVKGKTVMVYNN